MPQLFLFCQSLASVLPQPFNLPLMFRFIGVYLTYKDIKDLTGNVDALTNKILQLSHKTELEELKNDFVMKFNKINAKLREISEKEGKIEKNLRSN